jgi:hypothetical protein
MRIIEDGHGVSVSDAAPAIRLSASRREVLLGAARMMTAAALTTRAFSADADKADWLHLPPLERRDNEHGYNQGRRPDLLQGLGPRPARCLPSWLAA